MNITTYDHHGQTVKVRSDLKGKHWEYCLCGSCVKLDTQDADANCPIASELYELCRYYNLVTPVWECPDFEPE